ncbi:MAG: Lrp/AsnC family transcriptional regulator [Methanomassiliicoccales archaeon]
MDKLDVEILRILRANSRESLGNIAERLGVSKATVSRRISRMEREGYISGYTTIMNLSRMGVMRALIFLEVVGSAINSVIEELKKFDEIEYIHKVFGDHSLICEVYTRSVDNLYQLIQGKILTIPQIHNVEVDILIERISLNPDADFNTAAGKSTSST